MADRAFSVGNYKAFAAEVDVTIRPVTLFFGYNSAGKSAILRWLPFLRDSSSHSGPVPLNMSAPAIRGATFSGILSKFTSSLALGFSVTDGATTLRYVVRDLPDQRRQIVESMRLTSAAGDTTSLKWLASEGRPNAYYFSNGDAEDVEVNVVFSGLFPAVEGVGHPQVIEFGIEAALILQKWVSDVYWLQANRASPTRREVYAGTQGALAPDGSGITQILYDEAANGSDIVEALSDWYQAATGFRLTLQRGAFLSAELFSFCLETAGGVIELADTGEGMGQVLPILGLLLLALRQRLGNHPTLVFEHPELHLHSAAEPALANLLCEVAASGTASIIAETHSESFLLAVQLALIEGRLRPEHVVVYWVRQSDGSAATISEITFGADGRPSGGSWPPGVFNEKVEQARKVVLARRARQAHAD